DTGPWRRAGPDGFHLGRQRRHGALGVRRGSQSAVRSGGMRPIAATNFFKDTPPLKEVTHRSVTILGSTGSIGVNTLDVIAHARKIYGAEAFPLVALTAQNNVALLIEQAKKFRPRRAVVGDAALYDELKKNLSGTGIEAEAGRDAVIAAAGLQSDFVMVAIMGA